MLALKKITKKTSLSSLEEMFKSGLHFGYSRAKRHPKMKDFVYGTKNNIEIFDLEKTRQKLDEAKDFLKDLAKEKKKILFVGTKTESKKLIEDYAKGIIMPYVNKRWVGGTLTNFKTIRGRINQMEDLIKNRETGELAKYTKKEQLEIEKEISRLKSYFSGLEDLRELPSAMVVVDPKEERISVNEAKKMHIPVVAIANTDCDPSEIDYPIPANDNSRSSVEFLLKELVGAYKEDTKQS